MSTKPNHAFIELHTRNGIRFEARECPICDTPHGLALLLPPHEELPLALTLCDCTVEQVADIDRRFKRLQQPNKTVSVAARVIAHGGAIRIAARSEPVMTLEDLFTVVHDPRQFLEWTRLRAAAATTEIAEDSADTVPEPTEASPSAAGGIGGVGGVGGPSLPEAIAEETDSIGQGQVPLVHPTPSRKTRADKQPRK